MRMTIFRTHSILRCLISSFVVAASLICATTGLAQVTVNTVTFTALQPGRTYMDIGGVWNGSAVTAVQGGALTTGDSFSFYYSNGGSTEFEFKPVISYPANFTPIGLPIISELANCGSVTDLIYSSGFGNGTAITLLSTPANNGGAGGFDLPAGCRFKLTIQGMMAASATQGSVTINANSQTATTDGGTAALAAPQSLVVPVKKGLSTISKTPNDQTKALGQTASWPDGLSVWNTGLGGLFNVTLNESAISGMLLTSLSATGATCAGSVCTLPYLAPGLQMLGSATATVNSCQNITNTLATSDVTGATAKNISAQVTLDLRQPLLTFTAPSFSIPYAGTQAVSILVTNTSIGTAREFSPGTGIQLVSNLPALGVNVVVTSPGWTYAAGVFRFTGTIVAGASQTLTFNATPTDACSFVGGSLVMTAQYADDCDNQYKVPTSVGAVTAISGTPRVMLSKATSISEGTSIWPRQALGTDASYNITANLINFANIQGPNIVITDVLPNITVRSIVAPPGTSFSCAGPCVMGATLTWTIPKATLGAGPNASPVLQINYTAPTDTCLAGGYLTNTVNYTGFTSALPANSCPLTGTSSQFTLLTLTPGTGVSQYFNVTNPSRLSFETGLPDVAPTGVSNKPNEGDLIPAQAIYSFGPASVGTWAGSTYVDDFGTLPAGGAQLSSNTLVMQIDNGSGTFVTVPNATLLANATCATGSIAAGDCVGSMTINLGFLAGPSFFGTTTIAAAPGLTRRFKLDYGVVMNDAAMTAVGFISRTVTQIITLTIAGDTSGCNGAGITVYRQGDTYDIGRARPIVTLVLPNALDVCEPTNLPIDIKNSPNNTTSYNLLTTLLSGSPTDWRYTIPQTPVYGGAYTTLPLTYTPNAGVNPSWAHTSSVGPLSAPSTINTSVFLGATVAGGATVAALRTSTDYDDNQTAGGLRDFAGINGVFASSNIPLVRKGLLVSTVSPQTIFATGTTAQWKVFLTNTGNGTAYNSQFSDVLPVRLIPDAAGTNALNTTASCAPQANCNVIVSGQTISFNLGDIPPGQTRTVFVKVGINNTPASCTPIPNAPGDINIFWGCGTPFENAQTLSASRPIINFPVTEMTVDHEPGNTVCIVCGTSSARIVVSNRGAANVTNVTVAETLYTATQGTDYIAGSSEYSIDGGITWLPASDPVLSAGTYRWTRTQVPALAELWPQSQATPTQPYRVHIRFNFSTTALTATVVSPRFDAQTTATMVCGDLVDSGVQPFSLVVLKPAIAVSKTGINRTAVGGAVGSGSYVENVYGGVGDVVEWQITATNSGGALAKNIRLLDIFPGAGAASMSIVAGPVCPGVTYPIVINSNTATANLCDLPFAAGTNTHIYFVQETLGNVNCNSVGINTAKISYGCIAAAAGAESGVNGLAGQSDTANVIRQSDLSAFSGASGQQFFQESNGRIRVELNIANAGGTAQTINIASVLSIAGVQGSWVRDLTTPARLYGSAVSTAACVAPPTSSNAIASNYTCGCTGPTCLSNTVSTSGSATAPTFTLSGSMRNATSAVLVFYVLPTNHDTTKASSFADWATQESTANGLDPAPLGALQLASTLNYQSTCSAAVANTNTSSFTSGQPDLDIFLHADNNPAAFEPNRVVSSGVATNFVIRVRNVGTANSVASALSNQFVIGNGWGTPSTFSITATSGTGFGSLPIACTYTPGSPTGTGTCNLPATASLAQNQEYVIQFTATPTYAAGASLMLQMSRAAGETKGFDDVSTGNLYALDAARYRIVGASMSKTLLSTTESTSTSPTVLIGEEVTWNLNSRLWGFPGETLTGITYRDSYAKTSGANLHQSLGLVSDTDAGSTFSPIVAAGFTPVANATPWQQNYTVASQTGEAVFNRNVVTRVLNTPSSAHNSILQNNLGASFTYGGQVFHSDSAFDGPFTGGTSLSISPSLHAENTVTVLEPQLTITKQVMNLTTASSFDFITGAGFSTVASGDSSHDFIYRIVINNANGAAPAFNLSLTDTLSAKLDLYGIGADALTNARNAFGWAVTGTEGGTTAGSGGTVTFNELNTTLPAGAAAANLAQLDAGQSLILLYKVKGIPASIAGGDTVLNTANLAYSTLPGVSGSQTAPAGASGAVTGERTYTLAAQASIFFSRIYGRVYLDNNHNGSADVNDTNYVGTGVATAPTPLLCAQLIQGTLQGSTLLSATGNYSFSSAPSGAYEVRIVQALAGPACPAAIAPAWSPITYGYIPLENDTQSIRFVIGSASAAGAPALNFGLFQGTKITGKVFLDNTGLTTANDRLFNAQDVGLSGIPVCANNSGVANCAVGASLLDATSTDGSGSYTLWVPLPLSPTPIHVVNAGGGRVSTGASVNSSPLANGSATNVGGVNYTYTYAAGADFISFNAVFGASFGTLNFGEINPQLFTNDGVATVPAGSVRYYPHVFTATTTGSVSFATSNISTPLSANWTEQVFRDANCDGQIDAGDTLLTAPIALLAGQSVCVLLKENVPVTAAAGTSNTVAIQANFTPANNTLVAVQTVIHTDTTTVTAPNAGGLRLSKLVRNVTTGTPFAISNTGSGGQVLEYQITYSNAGASDLGNVVVQDATPPYTTFNSATVGALPLGITACSKITPQGAVSPCTAVQASGGTGLLRWTFTGVLGAGQTGVVTFQVQVQP